MVLGVIPARKGSKGLPGKNLRPLGGVPLIIHTIRAARDSRRLTDFLVSTDDPKTAEIAQAADANVPFLRPMELATDGISLWPVVRHAVEYWEQIHDQAIRVIALLQPTSPLRTGDDIDRCILRFDELDADICATAVAAHENPYFKMVEVIPESPDFIRPCSPFMLKSSRRQDAPRVYALNGAVYVVRRSILSTLENQFQIDRFAIFEMPPSRSVDIDSQDDLEFAEWILARGATR